VNWQNVKELRKAGDLRAARAAALSLLEADPNDFHAKTQLYWVTYDEIKMAVGRIGAETPLDPRARRDDISFVTKRWEEYRSSDPRVPDLACSMIVEQLAKVASELSCFADVVYWLRMDGLREEDWQPSTVAEKSYPSRAAKIALALCKWIKAHPSQANSADMDMALHWLYEARATAVSDQALWLDWNAAILLRQRGDIQKATELLAGVIKAKRNEFWVWAEAGRLYHEDQPELALACFCRALECPAEPKFLGKVHRELAELLAEQENYPQASRQILHCLEIRESQGWKVGPELESLMAKSWYDPADQKAEDSRAFYARHSPAAMALCFDVVETMAATYLGQFSPYAKNESSDGRKPKPLTRFAVRDDKGASWSLVGQRIKGVKLEVGAPVLIVVGRQEGDERQSIVHVATRQEGRRWDCLESSPGIVTRGASSEKALKVFAAELGLEMDLEGAADAALKVGDGVIISFSRNQKNSRPFAFDVRPGAMPSSGVRRIQGEMRRHPKGFAFIDDAFVSEDLVRSLDDAVNEVTALAVLAQHPKKAERSWRVVALSATRNIP
jgi:tetratricopeptide (TPR) repeat protein